MSLIIDKLPINSDVHCVPRRHGSHQFQMQIETNQQSRFANNLNLDTFYVVNLKYSRFTVYHTTLLKLNHSSFST